MLGDKVHEALCAARSTFLCGPQTVHGLGLPRTVAKMSHTLMSKNSIVCWSIKIKLKPWKTARNQKCAVYMCPYTVWPGYTKTWHWLSHVGETFNLIKAIDLQKSWSGRFNTARNYAFKNILLMFVLAWNSDKDLLEFHINVNWTSLRSSAGGQMKHPKSSLGMQNFLNFAERTVNRKNNQQFNN